MRKQFCQLIAAAIAAAAMATISSAAEVQAHFSTQEQCVTIAAREVDTAKKSVLMMAYHLTEPTMAASLANAAQRGVRVAVIVDAPAARQRTAAAPRLAAVGMSIYADAAHRIMHNKTIVIDGFTTITGSANWTEHANRLNAENIVVIRDGGTAAAYTQDWQRHLRHSQPITGPRLAPRAEPVDSKAAFHFQNHPTPKGALLWHASLDRYIPTPLAARMGAR